VKVYLSALNGGGEKIYANKIYCNGWELFELKDVEENKCTIQAINGLFLSVKDEEVYADSKVATEYSIFEKIKISDEAYAFSTSNNKFLSIPSLITKR
jgi:hypothetical protein